MLPIDYKFKTKDPINRTIYCTENTWSKISFTHPLIETAEEVESAINSPDSIYYDKSKNTTENFYKSLPYIDKSLNKYTKVCVSFEGEYNHIVTALRVQKIHKMDKPKWKS
jgi:hypothetical protein